MASELPADATRCLLFPKRANLHRFLGARPAPHRRWSTSRRLSCTNLHRRPALSGRSGSHATLRSVSITRTTFTRLPGCVVFWPFSPMADTEPEGGRALYRVLGIPDWYAEPLERTRCGSSSASGGSGCRFTGSAVGLMYLSGSLKRIWMRQRRASRPVTITNWRMGGQRRFRESGLVLWTERFAHPGRSSITPGSSAIWAGRALASGKDRRQPRRRN